MRKRRKLGKRLSRRDFTRKSGVHPKNTLQSVVMRGGIRL